MVLGTDQRDFGQDRVKKIFGVPGGEKALKLRQRTLTRRTVTFGIEPLG